MDLIIAKQRCLSKSFDEHSDLYSTACLQLNYVESNFDEHRIVI